MTKPLRNLILALVAAAANLAGAPVLAQAGKPVDSTAAPSTASRPIPGRYIVVFKQHVSDSATEASNVVRGAGGQLHHTYRNGVKGFAASLPEAALQGLRNNPNIDYIEQDQTVSIRQVSPEDQATWGLDRIDQFNLPLNTQYYFNYTGAGVHAFIIDTGIRTDHTEFTGRTLPGFTSISDGNGTNDCDGHGTHVAGTVGGTVWGVAKGVMLVPVRVLDCTGSGSWSGVVAGLDWVAGSSLRPAVANMSLGGGASAAVDAAVANAVAKGVTVVVAAGNSNANACNYSPAREPSAITVGATTSTDARASYSNYGSCVDIFGPGSSITSAWNTSPTAINTISGTSMATPHVTGVAALALAANPQASPGTVAAFLVANATSDVLNSLGSGSPNKLLYSRAPGAPATPVVQTVAVKSLAGQRARSGSNWVASAVATIRDVNTGAVVPYATVTGSFAPGGTGTCVTGTSGSCTLTSAVINKSTASTVFTMGNISGANMAYNAGQNLASQVVILRP